MEVVLGWWGKVVFWGSARHRASHNPIRTMYTNGVDLWIKFTLLFHLDGSKITDRGVSWVEWKGGCSRCQLKVAGALRANSEGEQTQSNVGLSCPPLCQLQL